MSRPFYWREFYAIDRRVYDRGRIRTAIGSFRLALRCWRTP